MEKRASKSSQKFFTRRHLAHSLQEDFTTPATKLLEKRKELYETQEALEKEKDNFRNKENKFKRQENELRDKDLKIQESLIRFSKYLEENKVGDRGEQTVKEILSLDQKIQQKKEEIEQIKAKCAQSDAEVQQMRIYEEILNQITSEVNEQDELSDIGGLMGSKRDPNIKLYVPRAVKSQMIEQIVNLKLKDSKMRLQKKIDELNEQIEQQNTHSLVKEMTEKRIAINNRIGRKQKELEAIEEEKSRLQTHFEEINGAKVAKIRLASIILMRVYTLGELTKARTSKFSANKGKEQTNFTYSKEKFSQTMELIKRQIEDFDKVIKEMEQDPKKRDIMNGKY